MNTGDLAYHLERTIEIRARPTTIFSFFTDSERFARWWGDGSSIDPRPGGRVHIRYPNDIIACGEVLEVEPDRHIAFTFGYEAPDRPIPPGGSRVDIRLEPTALGTMLRLRHHFTDEAARDAHLPGWRYQLAVFANVAADVEHAAAGDLVDQWCALWNEADAAKRSAAVIDLTRNDVVFKDRFACLRGRDELSDHLEAIQMHRPGKLRRCGEPRHCQGGVLAEWLIRSEDGEDLGHGTNFFELDGEGAIVAVIGFADS